MPAATLIRLTLLDAWRGVACMSVVLFHAFGRYVDESHVGLAFAPMRLVAAGGWIGVPLFFTISGYCMAATARALAMKFRISERSSKRLATFHLR